MLRRFRSRTSEDAGDYVEAITHNMEGVRAQRTDINNRIAIEERDGREPTAAFQTWLDRSRRYEEEVERIQKAYDQRGCASSRCCSNYSIGKKAFKMGQKLQEILSQPGFEAGVTQEQLPPAVQVIPTSSQAIGPLSNIEIALRFLKEGQDPMLGIWGTGGVGKSRLLTEINNSLTTDALGFDLVILVVACCGCTVEKLDNQIRTKLNLGSNVSLTNYLMRKNFLLLLDDVWEPLKLTEVGIPIGARKVEQSIKRGKVIVVSRKQNVCNQMQIKQTNIIHVECLQPEDAWRLFEENAGVYATRFREEAQGIVRECKGLPLALVVIGCAMSSRSTIQEWQQALLTLQRNKHIEGTEEELYSRLKLSYDYLPDDITKPCFLYCSLWPEDDHIYKNDLIEFWMGKDLIKNYLNIAEAYRIGGGIIESLKRHSLLENVGFHMVKMHDVIRDMTIWIANECAVEPEKWLVCSGVSLEGALKEATRWEKIETISFSGSNAIAMPSTIDADYDNVATVMLHGHRISDLDRLKFFSRLTFLDLSVLNFEYTFPKVIFNLVELEYLDISGNKLNVVPEPILKLKNLKYLLAKGCGISSVPQGLFSNLTKLIMLDISSPWYNVNQGSIIEQLNSNEGRRLKAVGIHVSSLSDIHKLNGVPIFGLTLQGMEGVKSLLLLSSHVLGCPSVQSTLHKLTISHCSGSLEELVIEGDHSLKFLDDVWLYQLPGLTEVIWKALAPKSIFPRLSEVRIGHCNKLKHVSWVVHLPCLEYLFIGMCDDMKIIIDEQFVETTEDGGPIQLHGLKELQLFGLPSLHRICSTRFTFPSLERLFLLTCAELKTLPFGLHAGDHASLKNIFITREIWEGLLWDNPDIKTVLEPMARFWQT